MIFIVSSVIVGVNDEEVDLQYGSRHIMPYKLAADLLKNGDVQLLWPYKGCESVALRKNGK